MIKLILTLTLIVSASFVGNSFSQRLINRRKTLTKLLGAISHAKTLICFGGAEVSAVIEESFCNDGFKLLDFKSSQAQLPYDKAFADSVNKISSKYALTKSDKELLIQFGVNLGSTDVTGQVAHTELYAQLFTERLCYVKEQELSKSKLYRILGFSFGCLVSLIIV